MDPKKKFRIKTYLYYLAVEPWVSKVSLPNFRTLVWIILFVAIILKNQLMIFIFLAIGIISYLTNEYKSGKYIHWYRQRKFKERNEALKKIRLERKRKMEEEIITS